MTAPGVVLAGLDGANPLGFLAAVGALRVLHADARSREIAAPTLRWLDDGSWRPMVRGPASVEEIVATILADLETWSEDPALALAYTRDGALADPEDSGAVRDLKPPPAIMRVYLDDLASTAHEGHRRSADLALALGAEHAFDRQGNVKPTALHFTAGQQQFLRMVDGLREGITRDHVVQALVGPWTRAAQLPTFAWDAMSERMWALRATNPASEKRGGEPGADWLAIQGLFALPVAARGGKLLTTAVRGGWKDSVFTWPLWTVPSTYRTVRSLLGWGDLPGSSPAERAARCIGAVFESSINRPDKYGSFSPSRML